MRVYICIYVYVYIYMYVYIYVRYMCICVSVYIHIYTYTHIYIYMLILPKEHNTLSKEPCFSLYIFICEVHPTYFTRPELPTLAGIYIYMCIYTYFPKKNQYPVKRAMYSCVNFTQLIPAA